MKNNYVAVFPGQGAQTMHMCQRLYNEKKYVRDIFKKSSEILDYDIWNIIDNGNLRTLTQTPIAQPAVFIASYIMFNYFLEKCVIKPKVLLGHSLGEISALVCAGAIDFEPALRFVKERAILMDNVANEKIGFSGAVTDLEEKSLVSIIKEISNEGYITISCYNSPKQLIVAGDYSVEKQLDKKIADLGGEYIPFRMIPMKVSAPYHSGLMKKYEDDFKVLVSKLKCKSLKIPVLSTVSGKFIDNSSEIPELLVKQMSSPVLWTKAFNSLLQHQYNCFVDIGPSSIMKNLMLEFDDDFCAYSFIEEESTLIKLFEK